MKKIQKSLILLIAQQYEKKYLIISALFILIILNQNLFAQNAQFIQPYFWGEGDYTYYVLNKNLIHDHVSSDINLYGQPYNGTIVYVSQDTLLSFIVDPFWDRIVYANYHDTWIKSFSENGTSIGQFKHPRGVSTDEIGNIYIADTYNSRVVKLRYNSTNIEIDPSSFSSIGESILYRPWDLDLDDIGNLNPSDDIIWVVDKGNGQIVPLTPGGSVWENKTITSLNYEGTVYNDLSGICGIAIRKDQGTNANYTTVSDRIYLVDRKLRKLFLVEAHSIQNGVGTVSKIKSFADDVLLSGVESDYFGDVWVVDNANGKLYKYTWDLNYLDQLSGLNYPTSVSSVRRHHLNMAITEQWTNSTGNRTYQHGVNIRNLVINSSYTNANFSFRMTNFNYLTAKIYKGNALQKTMVNNTLYSSGNKSLNWHKGNPSGIYRLKLWARSYDDPDNVFKYITQTFYFPLKPVTISGLNQLMIRQSYTYTANTSGGSEAISYQWYKKYKDSSYWNTLGTASSQEVTMTNKDILLKVVVSSGNESNEFIKNIEYDDSPPEAKTLAEAIPDVYLLHNNYPNPFNPLTTIKYDLPEDSFVEINIFDLLGREVRNLISENIKAGFKTIRWDSKDNNGKTLSSGVYIYTITAKSLNSEKLFSKTKKMVLIK